MDKVKINFKKKDWLVPVIIQEFQTKDVLMLGYMSKEAFKKTLKENIVYFWSRERKKLWMKGESSGNRLKVKKVFLDCDGDTFLIQVDLIGKYACHTGKRSCFSRYIQSRTTSR